MEKFTYVDNVVVTGGEAVIVSILVVVVESTMTVLLFISDLINPASGHNQTWSEWLFQMWLIQ